jgi:hypothetical protein
MRLPLPALVLGATLYAQTAPATIDVSPAQPWTDTGIDLRRGDAVVLTATGTLTVMAGRDKGVIEAAGKPRGFRDMIKTYQVNTAGLGALIGRIGSSDATEPFAVGARKEMQVPRGGRLFLGLNMAGNEPLEGAYHVTVEFTTRGPENAAPPADLKLPAVTQEMIDRIPRRVVDAQDNPGDNTNFVVVGSEKQVLGAFEAAGWVKVDRSNSDAVLAGVMAVLSKQAYLTLPMSILTLFGRPQDYGLAHAEPLAVVAQRHHLRLWKAPFQVEGQELWVGAATHDIGFDRDQRNNGVTHKIDPAVDDEREFVGRSLDETGLIAKQSYMTPSQPSKEARTATGATFHSDGRVLVINLVPETVARTQ